MSYDTVGDEVMRALYFDVVDMLIADVFNRDDFVQHNIGLLDWVYMYSRSVRSKNIVNIVRAKPSIVAVEG